MANIFDFYRDFSAVLENERVKQGLTKYQVCCKSTRSYGTVCNVLNADKFTSMDSMLSVAKALGVMPRVFLEKIDYDK